MKLFIEQFQFDFKREILRNQPFLFFSLLMPAGFYVLFTKIMTSGSAKELRNFAGTYMGNMIVYSVIISAFFGMSALLQRDRRSGYFLRLQQTPAGARFYYLSIGACFMLMTILAISIMFILAVGLNHVSLNLGQIGLILMVSLLGEIPMFIIGVMISHVQREETLSVISNLLTFPIAVTSGLWWPLAMLPSWLQQIGKLLPTYHLSRLLHDIVAIRPLAGYDWLVITSWILITLGLALIQNRLSRSGQQGVMD